MTRSDTGTATRTAELVGAYFADPLEALRSTTSAVAEAIEAARRSGDYTSARLDALAEPHALATFEATVAPVYGAGFIAALNTLSDAPSHLAWWQGPQRKQLQLAGQSVNKERIDYSELEWYRMPMLTRQPHVAGPYVDYLCSDEYTITLAVPVFIGEEFLGVAGLDLLVEEVERDLSPLLAEASDAPVTIVNGAGRVVLSTDLRRATGDSLRGPATAGLERATCGGIALEVFVGS
ncbi:cache domain-containing protein [Herbiconiux sp. SYSU D00978]|uniref:cache domain-containing protein n=1 Tax=Herbiconiux sp. SYSU D00978 TaxID=2812562 RepID=UPI001A97C0D9|nr:cache domain-containing protein [Herbiconiux sp. SYSU D00978]